MLYKNAGGYLSTASGVGRWVPGELREKAIAKRRRKKYMYIHVLVGNTAGNAQVRYMYTLVGREGE